MSGLPSAFSARQTVSRDTLDQIFPNVPGQLLDLLLRSINIDLKSPLRVDASATPDLTVTVGPGVVNNTISGRQQSIPFINSLIPSFTSGSVVFPSTDGGNIVVSPGSDVALDCPSGLYNKALLSLDSSGDIILTQGTPNAVEANVLVPSPVSNALPICYISLHNLAGVVQPVQQNKIFQFGAGGGGSGGGTPQSGFAQEVSLSLGDTEVTVSFPSALPGVNYVAFANFVNLVDGSPDFQEITITNKTTGGFTAKWNAALDSANYKLAYLVPVVQIISGEFPVSLGDTTAVIPLSIPQAGVNYSVVCGFVNQVDGSPQFQPIEVVGKSTSNFTVKWNSGCDSGNYLVAYHLAQYQ